ncbi:MAG: hypothetical protein KGZ72_01070 [Roseovarius sp.]|nr:hypothetical protein [Roseovarius sp.]
MAFAAAILIPSAAISQQGFSCSYGDRGACLGFGDTVCSSRGMCVDQNAACFDSNQCNYEGFTCKSNVTECVEAHDNLLRKHNDLVEDFNDNLKIAKEMASRLGDVETCLIYASTLEAAKRCAP